MNIGITIEENRLARSDLPIDIDENFEINESTTGRAKKEKKVSATTLKIPKVNRSKVAKKEITIEKPDDEKNSLINMLKEKKVEKQVVENVSEGGATEILDNIFLDDIFISRLYLEFDSPRGKQQIEIDAAEFFIGKSTEGDVNAVISFNNAISRVHCLITCEDDCYYVEDLGSANGTYLNKRKLEYGYKQAIRPNDELHLANMQFYIRER